MRNMDIDDVLLLIVFIVARQIRTHIRDYDDNVKEVINNA